ncbi:Rieske (2Fe-2S) protein [Streptomyces radicis]|uniref:Cytochrome bc1 complex Rieske iron-sulfur subunit n=1 Tax=Streptomyces radicis TaxID=1750517 RepID=A0A3A9WM31_9ACTN|nr:Rieske (2Fe-2S) protein [Streptomyces radicis]RKN07207.1 Rieske (2Fe-2S) protein [Streptomyces radicis]RKN26775.1 Rieske (2Fe-2S) protein [Streptomyces radicis]
MTATPHTRRALLAATAASAGALALTACGDDSGGSGGSGGSSGPGADDEAGSDGGSGDADSGGAPGSLAALDDVPVGEAFAATTPDGEEAFLFRADEATVAAFSAICTHAGCSVVAEGAELACPCHNSRFDAATGEVLQGPAGEPLPAIGVRIEGDRIVAE